MIDQNDKERAATNNKNSPVHLAATTYLDQKALHGSHDTDYLHSWGHKDICRPPMAFFSARGL